MNKNLKYSQLEKKNLNIKNKISTGFF
jgi:hypothetical protein